MGNKKEYRSAKRSRMLIRRAFMELLHQKDLSKITVTDIVTLADINRATFYAHYPDVYGVIEEIEREIIEKLLSVLKDFHYADFFNNPTRFLLQINRYLEDDFDFYQTLIAANGAQLFLEKLKDIFISYMKTDDNIPENVRNTKMFTIRAAYFAGGIVDMYRQWFHGKLSCSLEDIAVEIGKIIQSSAKDFDQL